MCGLGLGTGVGGRGRVWGEKGLLDQSGAVGERRICCGMKKTRSALSIGSCFLSARSSYTMSSWQLGDISHPPPFPSLSAVALRGSVHKAWQL